SVRMWRDYLPTADSFGVDINPKCKSDEGDRMSVAIGDQADPDFLRSVAGGGKFEIILDDGSHIWKHQIESFVHLWPRVAPGGLYIVEDLQTSKASHAKRYGEGQTETAAAYFCRLAQAVLITDFEADQT